MRDIRQDLRERLTALEQRRDQLQSELRVLDDESTAVIRLLDFEDRRFPSNGLDRAPEQPVGDFILGALKARSLTKDEAHDPLVRAGYGQGGEAVGRMAHLALVNLEKAAKVAIGEDHKYCLPTAIDGKLVFAQALQVGPYQATGSLSSEEETNS